MNKQNSDIRPFPIQQNLPRSKKMFHLNLNPNDIVKAFSKLIRVMAEFLYWAVLGIAAIAAAFIALGIISLFVRLGLKIFGF
jgi:hypothetical protein